MGPWLAFVRYANENNMIESVLVFCGSSTGKLPVYAAAAKQLGEVLAQRQLTTVYGAGKVGLMGILADAALQAKGEVVGVIPHFLREREVCHEGLTELYLVDSMDARKKKMAELSDAVITLPGGFGTLDELFEMATLVQLRQDNQPIGILNVNRYFDPLLEQIDRMIQAGFVKESQRDLILVDGDPHRLLDRLAAHQPQAVEKWVDR